MNTWKSLPVWGLALGLVGVGCNAWPVGALPPCQDGQSLKTTADGQLACGPGADLSKLKIPPLGCGDAQALAYDDQGRLVCVDKAQFTVTHQGIDTLAQTVAAITQSTAQLQALGVNYSETLYVGSTKNLTTGRITLAGQSGLAAAAGLCAAEFGAGASMCTPFPLIRSVARGKLSRQDRIAPAWVYMPTYHNPNASTTEPLAGLADNCGGYTTEVDTLQWTGTAVEWGPLAADVVFRWHGGNEALCSTLLPIACCKGGTP